MNLKDMFKKELEKEKQYSYQLEKALQDREQAYLSSLKKIERAYIAKLEELCQNGEEQEPTESEIFKQLSKLWHKLRSLEEQLKQLEESDTESLETQLNELEATLRGKYHEHTMYLSNQLKQLNNKLNGLQINK